MKNSMIVSTCELFPVTMELLEKGTGVKFTVSGDSMMPWIRSYKDQVLLVPVEKIKTGDIVLFKIGEKYILHRVYRVNKELMLTMGDGCLYYDGYFPFSCVIGKVDKIYRGPLLIDCKDLKWIIVFTLWRKLRFMRKGLFKVYRILVRIKGRIYRSAANSKTG